MKSKIISTIFLSLIVLFALTISCNAASLTVTPSKSSVDPGETFSVTVTLNNGAGNISTSVSNGSGSKTAWLDSSSYDLSVTAGNSGTVTISASGTAADYTTEEDEDVSESASVSINASEPDTNTNTEPDTNTNTEPDTNTNTDSDTDTNTETKTEETGENTNTEEQKEEITFTAASGTVYTTTDSLNLRSTTDGSVIGSIAKTGTELEVTGKSDDKVRVKYEGKEGYVVSKYVTSTKPEEKEEEKSNNANLKSLVVDGMNITPEFNADVTSYSLEVGNEINEVSIKAEPEDSKSTVDIKGNKDFKVGDNKIAVTVSAEDGTTKIYEINVKKTEAVALGLKTLTIEGTDIASKFKTGVYKYEIDVKDIDKLVINAEPTIEGAKVEITGNENLQDGANIVKIIVKSEDGKDTVTYQITVNKNLQNLAATLTTGENKTDNSVYLYGGICIVALILLIILIIKLTRNKSKGLYVFDNEHDDENSYEEDSYEEDKQEYKNEFAQDFNDEDEGKKPRRGKHF